MYVCMIVCTCMYERIFEFVYEKTMCKHECCQQRYVHERNITIASEYIAKFSKNQLKLIFQ